MTPFVPGMTLCEGFYRECAAPILAAHFPALRYSAGLIGYGSDVIGCDDAVSADHMWGPRFYLFLDAADMPKKETIFRALSEHLPCTYRGCSVNYTAPDPADNGVQHPEFVEHGPVHPLVFIETFDDFLRGQLGTADPAAMTPAEWLAVSEHRLLSLVSGRFFADDLHLAARLEPIRFYPDVVQNYLIASNWDIIASEQAFIRRAADVGDDIGSRILTARIAERLMRLCFLYRRQYAPYSKWFGTLFRRLDIDPQIGIAIDAALTADAPASREDAIVEAQVRVARLHNESGITPPVDFAVERYYGRAIKVIFADRFADAASALLAGTPLEAIPLLGSLSQCGGLSNVSDDPENYAKIAQIYR